MAGLKRYSIQGYVTTEVCVEIGTWESAMSLHDCWDMIMQIKSIISISV